MAEAQSKSAAEQQIKLPYTNHYPLEKEQPPEVESVLEDLAQCCADLLRGAGWIHESYKLDYQFTDDAPRDLIDRKSTRLNSSHSV